MYVMAIPVQTLHPVFIMCTLGDGQVVSQEGPKKIHHFTSSAVLWFGNRCFCFFFSNQISTTIGISQVPVEENICMHFSSFFVHTWKT